MVDDYKIINNEFVKILELENDFAMMRLEKVTNDDDDECSVHFVETNVTLRHEHKIQHDRLRSNNQHRSTIFLDRSSNCSKFFVLIGHECNLNRSVDKLR
jgi:hypothetical protein